MLQGTLKIRAGNRNLPPSAAWENFARFLFFANCAKTKRRIASILTDFDSALKNTSEYVTLIPNNPRLQNNFGRAIFGAEIAHSRARAREIILWYGCVRLIRQKTTRYHQFRRFVRTF